MVLGASGVGRDAIRPPTWQGSLARRFHALRTRKAGARRFLEFHLLVPGTMSVVDSHALCDRIEASLHAHFAKAHVTIHVEPNETSAPHQ